MEGKYCLSGAKNAKGWNALQKRSRGTDIIEANADQPYLHRYSTVDLQASGALLNDCKRSSNTE